MIAIARDITEQYESEWKFRLNEERFRQLFNTNPIGILMMNSYQEIRNMNVKFEEMFGYSASELKELNIDNMIVLEQYKEHAQGDSILDI